MYRAISFLLRLCWNSNKTYVLVLFFWKLVDAFLPLAIIIFPRYIIDELMGAQRIPVLLAWVGILLVVTLFGSMLSNYLMCRSLAERMVCYNAFQVQLAKTLMQADYERLEDPAFLDMREKAYKFLYGEGWGFATVLDRAVGIIGKIVTFIGIIAIIATLEPLMILLFVGLVLLSSLAEARGKKKLIAWDLERTPLERRCMYYGDTLSDYNYGKEIRNYHLGDWLIGRYRDQLKTLRAYYDRSARTNTQTQNVSALLNFVQQGAAYAYLIYQVLIGAVGIGAFTMYLNAISVFSSSMKEVMSSIVDIRRFEAYYQAADEFIHLPSKMHAGKRLAPADRGTDNVIEFRNVSYCYRGHNRNAIDHVSFTLKNGEKLAIVGENGAGKSTLIKLMIRLYDPTEGEILFNGVDIRELDYDQYIRMFSTVFQDYQLFSFTMEENVAFEQADIAHDQVEEILNRMGLTALISSLPLGVKTPIHKDFDQAGVELSGGEGQKLALARAIYKDAPFVILDEPTAALDPRAEDHLYRLFDELVQNKAAVYISHRLSSTVFCDRIIVLDKGSIIEEGSHQDLMRQNGVYAELFQMQAQHYTAGNVKN